MKKIVLLNSITNSIRNHFPNVEFKTEDELCNPDSSDCIHKLNDVAIFVAGISSWEKVRELHNQGYIHIGLRNFTFLTVCEIPYVTLANNIKLIVARVNNQGVLDGTKIELFNSNGFQKAIPTPPEYEIVDLKDVDDALLRLQYRNPEGEFYGFDFESRGFPLQKGFKPLGFSIVGSEYGFYVDIRNYTDYHSPLYANVRKFIEENYKRLVVFNCAFEIRAVEHMWSEMLLFPDAWAIDLCDDFRAGLKPAAQYYLGVPSWDDEMEDEQNFFRTLMWGDKNNTMPSCPSAEVFFNRLKRPEYQIYRVRLTKIMNDTIERRIAGQNIAEKDVPEFSHKIKQDYKERIMSAWGNEWEMCDPWTLGKYCVFDSYYTKLIWDKLHGQYPKAEEPYHNNFYYGAFLESTGIPIDRKKLLTLEDYVDNVKINTGVFYVKFYLDCLEQTIAPFVDSLNLSEYAQKLMINYPWLLKEKSEKVLKELLKLFDSPDGVNWKGYANIIGRDIAQKVWEMTEEDTDEEGKFSVASACRRHRKQWETLGWEYSQLSKYQEVLTIINDRNLQIAKPAMAKFNKEVIDFVKPFNPATCKLCANWVEDPPKIPGQGSKKYNIWDVKTVHPETASCYNFIMNLKDKKEDDYYRKDYLGGRELKKVMAYITKEDLEWYRYAYNIHEALPPILLRECKPLELISVEEVANLLQLRNLKKELDIWDNMKVDQPYSGKVDGPLTKDHVRWLSQDLVQWSSDKKTFVVTISMLKRYGWLCSAITQFWNYWWSADHVPSEDPEVLKYAISSAQEDESLWMEDVKEYVYQSGDHGKKAERSVGVINFSQRFGFERWEIRDWLQYNITKDTTLNIEEDDNKLHRDWKNLYKFFIYWDLGQGADKQLNPYISGDKGMIANSWKLDRTLPDGSEIIDFSQHGDRFMTRFKICGVATKRENSCAA